MRGFATAKLHYHDTPSPVLISVTEHCMPLHSVCILIWFHCSIMLQNKSMALLNIDWSNCKNAQGPCCILLCNNFSCSATPLHFYEALTHGSPDTSLYWFCAPLTIHFDVKAPLSDWFQPEFLLITNSHSYALWNKGKINVI